ncbi:response regulator [Massilia oculi]|uniref:Response regulator n=1 Tax=Massilia hydrophila TaxID=3044279 RepID=A0ABS7YI08_9BURK|nr:response regulator [Massilia oculi]MCA1858154.1 response regulator [Massilia oculi]
MKVLVVDDDVVARMMLMHLVDSCGAYDIVEADDGEDGWRQLAAGLRPGIVFCDLRMPRLDGLGLLARVRAAPALAALPFVLVSAAADADTLAEAGRQGADGYIVKPFAAGQVRAQLTRLVHPDEEPAAVLRRLGIGRERLQAYLGGLQRQLEEAGSAIPPSRDRLLQLAEGCATLGLADSAARLRAAAAAANVADAAPASPHTQAALTHALGAVRRQQAHVPD